MRVLVAYSSKYGATRGIAERIGERLAELGHEVDIERCRDVEHPEVFDAFVIGSAAYLGRWRKEARKFARRNDELLAGRPTWLFSSGPLGTDRVDDEGNDVLTVTEPAEFEEFAERIRPRGTIVFFGALDIDKLRGPDRILNWMPAVTELPQGDFRDWAAIEAWTDSVHAQLAAQSS